MNNRLIMITAIAHNDHVNASIYFGKCLDKHDLMQYEIVDYWGQIVEAEMRSNMPQ